MTGRKHALDFGSGMGDEVQRSGRRRDEPETGGGVEDEAERFSGGSGELRSGELRVDERGG